MVVPGPAVSVPRAAEPRARGLTASVAGPEVAPLIVLVEVRGHGPVVANWLSTRGASASRRGEWPGRTGGTPMLPARDISRLLRGGTFARLGSLLTRPGTA